MSKLRTPALKPINGIYAETPIGICIPVYNSVGNPHLATAVWSLEQCCDLPFQLSLGIGPNCVAKNRNKALKRLAPEIEWVLMCDEDIIASPHFASKFMKIFEDTEIGAVSAVMQGVRGQRQNDLFPGDIGPGELHETTPPGTFFMYNRKQTPIEWDENYQASQWEDTDGMKQIQAMGCKTVGTGDVQIVHYSSVTPKLSGPTWNHNKKYFMEKWSK